MSSPVGITYTIFLCNTIKTLEILYLTMFNTYNCFEGMHFEISIAHFKCVSKYFEDP